jgi:excisionase family DNA binding protein
LSVSEACKLLNVSRQLIYRLVEAGQLPIVKLGDRTLFRPRDVEALIERSVRQSGTATADPNRAEELANAVAGEEPTS